MKDLMIQEGIEEFVFQKEENVLYHKLVKEGSVVVSKTTMRKEGVQNLVRVARTEAAAHWLPWNIHIHGPLVGEHYGILPYDEEVVGEYAGFAGWIKGLVELGDDPTFKYSWVSKGLERFDGMKGYCSDQTPDWWALHRRFRSPARFLSYVGKVHKNLRWKQPRRPTPVREIVRALSAGVKGRPSQVANYLIALSAIIPKEEGFVPWRVIYGAHDFNQRMGPHWPEGVNMAVLMDGVEVQKKRLHKAFHKLWNLEGGEGIYLFIKLQNVLMSLGPVLFDRIKDVALNEGLGIIQLFDSQLDKPLSEEGRAWMLANFKHPEKGSLVEIAQLYTPLKQRGWDGTVKSAKALIEVERYFGHRCGKFATAAAKAKVPPKKYGKYEDRWLNRETPDTPFVTLNLDLGKGYRAHVLYKDNPEGLFLGHYMGNCQAPGEMGSSCAWHGATHSKGAFLVVTHGDKYVAQSWIWESGENVVLDNIEVSHRTKAPMQLLKVAYEFQIIPELKKNYRKVLVGRGYSGIKFNATIQEGPKAPTEYTDAKNVYVF